jgi:hypothetical protein
MPKSWLFYGCLSQDTTNLVLLLELHKSHTELTSCPTVSDELLKSIIILILLIIIKGKVQVLDDLCGQLHAPAALATGKRAPDTHWRGGWVDPRTDVDNVEMRIFLTLPGLELQSLSHPAHGQSLYQLHYRCSYISSCVCIYIYKIHDIF